MSKSKTHTIQNDLLTASWDSTQKVLALYHKTAAKPFFIAQGSPRAYGNAKIETTSHPMYGAGQVLAFSVPSGVVERIAVYPNLPFVLVDKQLSNSGTSAKAMRKTTILSGRFDLDCPVTKLRTISTAGLLPMADSPAGYSFMGLADPRSRHGIVCGWLTQRRGSGIVSVSMKGSTPSLRAHIDYGDLQIPAQSTADSECIAIGYFADLRDGLEQYADAIAVANEITLRPKPTVYCTWYHAAASNEKDLATNAEYVAKELKPFGLTVMQIDDLWQDGEMYNGPAKNFTTHRPDGPYPHGMKPTADRLQEQGLTAGLWFMPFAGSHKDPFFDDKQEFFYQIHGKPYETKWGGTCIDMTNPKSRKYVGDYVRRIAGDWGYKYFKLDGLWTGTGCRIQYVNSSYRNDNLGKAERHSPEITPIEAYRLGFDTVRKAAGKDVFFLGCCVPQNMRSSGPAMGKVDAMRVGPDNHATPEGIPIGPEFTSRVYFLNGRVWHNDPDPAYVRPSLPLEMAKTSVSWTSLTGSLHSTSYNYYELPEERLELLKRSMPSHDLKTVRPVDYLESDIPRVWLLTDDRRSERHDVVGLFNWDVKKARQISYSLDRIGLPSAKEYVGFDYWSNEFIPTIHGKISCKLPAGGCKIISLRPKCDRPQLISTSRHLTQGVVDLVEETWRGNTLSGTSNVIAGDDYELLIAMPEGKKWKLKAVKAGGLKPEITSETCGLRIRLCPKKTGQLKWQLQFAK